MKRLTCLFAAFLAAMLFVMPVQAQEFTMGYPIQCTDSTTTPTIAGTFWRTCAQMNAGVGPLTPSYMRLQDGNSLLLGDVINSLQVSTAGIGPLANGLSTWAGNLVWNGAVWTALEYLEAGDAIAAAQRGIPTLSLGHFYDGATQRRWLGAQMNTDDVPVTTRAPWVGNFNHAWDSVNDNWDRMTGMDITLSLKDFFAIFTYSANMFLVGDTWEDWTGGNIAADDLATTLTGADVRILGLYGYDTAGDDLDRIHSGFFPGNFGVTSNGLKVMSGNYFWDITNGFFIRDQGDAPDNDAVPTTQPGAFRLSLGHIYSTDQDVFTRRQGETADGGTIAVTRTAAYNFSLDYGWDGLTWSPVDVVTTQADGLAFTLNGKVTSSFIYLDNGATGDKAKSTALGGLQVGQESYPPSEDFGNAQKSLFKKDTAVVAPAGQVTATIGTAAVTCLTGRYVLNDVNWCVTVENTDGADAMVDVDVQQSPDNAAPWVDLGWATCDTLAAGVACVKCFGGEPYAYIRVQCSALDANQTSSIVTYTANKN